MIDVWSDKAIPPGVEWEPEIDRQLSRADAAVIIVSPSLLKSKFVTKRELPRILDRHKRDGMRPMWIHCRPVMYERTPFSKLQALHDVKRALSRMRRPEREQALVDIARKICDAPVERPLANVLRAADEIFIGETRSRPGVMAQVGPTEIRMVTGSKQSRPFVTYAALNARLSPMDRKVLRGYERSMLALIRTWERLHPKEAAGIATADDLHRLSEVRRELAQELDNAVGFIERLGYRLDDHYIGVHDILASKVTRGLVGTGPKELPTIAARFVLDRRGRPQWSKRENGYWLQTWLECAPGGTASVVWRLHSTIRPVRETVEAAPEFRKDFVAHGDFTLRAELRTKRRAAVASVSRGLAEALDEQYPGGRAKPLQDALADIAAN
jgi:hypothetical protein